MAGLSDVAAADDRRAIGAFVRHEDASRADSAAERLFRDVRVDRIWEGTSEIMRTIILNGVMKRDLGRLLG